MIFAFASCVMQSFFQAPYKIFCQEVIGVADMASTYGFGGRPCPKMWSMSEHLTSDLLVGCPDQDLNFTNWKIVRINPRIHLNWP